MGEKKERRYAVDFEHFENAMLTEANLGWQVYMAQRWKMAPERRRKITLMLKRFAGELAAEIAEQKDASRSRGSMLAEHIQDSLHKNGPLINIE